MTVLCTRVAVAEWRSVGGPIGLVPTMGALHEGHLALVRAMRRHVGVCGRVLATVFVNPTQFGPGEDFEAYPRSLEADVEAVVGAGADAVFAPTATEMYPDGFQTAIHVGAVAAPLCGRHRAGHFEGVCTVVAKLFQITRCDAAIFGEKDYQQLAVIRRMTRDLDFGVEILGHSIVRDPDGLAMSSRNAYLDAATRARALAIPRSLEAARAAWIGGERNPRALEAIVRVPIEATGLADIDYVEARGATELETLDGEVDGPIVLAVAARFGPCRLIDNTVLTPLTP